MLFSKGVFTVAQWIINHLHERCLRIVHSDKTSSSEKLLETGRSVLIHIINLQIFATEIFKVSKDQAPTIFSEFFQNEVFSITCITFLSSLFQTRKALFMVHGTVCFILEIKIWDLVPKELKELSSLRAFKKAIKKWKPQNCYCRLCKKYVKIFVLFDIFSVILDKGLLPHFVSFLKRIGANGLTPEYYLKPDYFCGNVGRLTRSDVPDHGGEIWRHSLTFLHRFLILMF